MSRVSRQRGKSDIFTPDIYNLRTNCTYMVVTASKRAPPNPNSKRLGANRLNYTTLCPLYAHFDSVFWHMRRAAPIRLTICTCQRKSICTAALNASGGLIFQEELGKPR